MDKSESVKRVKLIPDDNDRLITLCGQFDDNLHFIESQLGVEINNRGCDFEILGIPKSVAIAVELLKQLYQESGSGKEIDHNKIRLTIKSLEADYSDDDKNKKQKISDTILDLKETTIKPRTQNQHHYLSAIEKNDIVFGIGPSGTGKTYLAVACAIAALEKEQVGRIVLVRPAVEAGESLGFLPGDLAQKVDPYLRPLYDALYEMLGVATVTKLISKGIIEIAPLAYMRGRTLNESFVIMDEGQNSTKEQMKMFLTRIGFGSKAIITGDITQIDLPKKTHSGLRHATSVLRDINGIHFSFFAAEDVVRHPLVQQIIEAYEKEGTPA